MHVNTRCINSIRGTSSDWGFISGVYVPCIYMHARWEFNSTRGTSSDWGCTWGGVCVPCIDTHARWVTVGDSGLCCCVCVTSFECWLTPLCVDSAQALWASLCFRLITRQFQATACSQQALCQEHKELGNVQDIHKSYHPQCQWFDKSLMTFWTGYLTSFHENIFLKLPFLALKLSQC